MEWLLRLAQEKDIPALEKLIPFSVRALQAPYYSRAQMEAALGPVFGVDRQLIRDETYFVVEHEGAIIGCGGWSKRRAPFGGSDHHGAADAEPLDPRRDAARIRAFFIRPDWARRGIGRTILLTCEAAAKAAGFTRFELVATLAGEPLYKAFGYSEVERCDIPLSNGLKLPCVKMAK